MVKRLSAQTHVMLIAAAALIFAPIAAAGNISLHMSLTGQTLTVTNQGDSTAFYPAGFRLLSDGRWVRLVAATPPAELEPGASVQLAWPGGGAAGQAKGIDQLQPVIMRFFDQAGVGFGQISFFRGPPPATETLTAGYDGSELIIERPDGRSSIRTSWVLWSREEGIGPIRLPIRFDLEPPSFKRIDWWQAGAPAVHLSTGVGRPAVILLHEHERGYGLQMVQRGGFQGREQRAAWLDARTLFYRLAMFALVAGTAAVVLHLSWALRRKGRK